jgi:hypothetical protein
VYVHTDVTKHLSPRSNLVDKSTYSLITGIALLVTSIVFFVLPAIIDNLDSFIPVMLAIVSLISALSFFGAGYASRR